MKTTKEFSNKYPESMGILEEIERERCAHGLSEADEIVKHDEMGCIVQNNFLWTADTETNHQCNCLLDWKDEHRVNLTEAQLNQNHVRNVDAVRECLKTGTHEDVRIMNALGLVNEVEEANATNAVHSIYEKRDRRGHNFVIKYESGREKWFAIH